jgi:hypothetical protein
MSRITLHTFLALPNPVRDCADEEKKKLLVCGSCKSTYCCCKQHQRQHWAEHKDECACRRRAMLAQGE